jgi:hypothetical protein
MRTYELTYDQECALRFLAKLQREGALLELVEFGRVSPLFRPNKRLIYKAKARGTTPYLQTKHGSHALQVDLVLLRRITFEQRARARRLLRDCFIQFLTSQQF